MKRYKHRYYFLLHHKTYVTGESNAIFNCLYIHTKLLLCLFMFISVFIYLIFFSSLTTGLFFFCTRPREGLSPPLAYTPLSESWSDNLYYFSTLSFKRSGNYTVSFLLEVSFDTHNLLAVLLMLFFSLFFSLSFCLS